jgi:hypothetical protein
MARYFAAPRQAHADWDDCYPLLPDIHVPEHRPIDTGLLDKRGDAIDNEW